MADIEKVAEWLTEISLRPCDFTRDDFDAYETEHLANDALELLKWYKEHEHDVCANCPAERATGTN